MSAPVTDCFTILLYHGVSRSPHRGIENCGRKHISAEEFDAQMSALASSGRVSSLTDLIHDSRTGRPVAGRVAVTFDDGFENNHSVAFPILQRHGMPATFFVTTGFVGTSRVFWVDQLEYFLNETAVQEIALTTLNLRLPMGTTAERTAALREVKRALKRSSSLVPDTLSELEALCRVVPRFDYPDYRMMTWDQAREMHRSGLCAFGAHTVDHVILAHASREQQEQQVLQSKKALETQLDAEVALFAYPEGQTDHFDDQVVEVVSQAGFTVATSAVFGRNTTGTSLFHLHRNMVDMVAPFDACVRGVQ